MTAAARFPSRRTPSPHADRSAGPRPRPDLDALTGLRSGKPSFYSEYRVNAERLRRVIGSLDRISAALVRTMEGSEALVRAVADAAADHLSADWVVLALVDGELTDAVPRHVVIGPDGVEWADLRMVPDRVRRHIALLQGGTGAEDDSGRRHLHVPIRLNGRTVGGFVAWTPPDREIDDTDHSVLRILAGQTASALQNCALLDRAERLHARTAAQAEDLRTRNDELMRTQQALGAARQREVLDNERHRIARELHDSVTQYALSAGMHIELCRSEIDDPRLLEHLSTAKDLTRRAVEQLRSAIYALNDDDHADKDLPSMLRQLSTVHMPDELRVEVTIGGTPTALPHEHEQSLFRIAGEALFNTAMHASASRAVVRLAYQPDRVRLSISDDGGASPDQIRRTLRAASVRGPSGEHRGLVNMDARAREMGGTLRFRRSRIGGLQVQVDVPSGAAGREIP
ncbi:MULTISPECIES: MadS family sensor histidine kinase [Pseudonocardia]|uniref:histidine kinase n=2 Tax=Pseudonocardia TaxID=1847 RepID=A0A1Y2N928_PSEAH|nr:MULTISPECIES: histidine kinase [Pseudonocardia]OSY43974.1 Sensor protein VraS [Pseudonocardia autotrophica]TDN74293.1 histidine kinase [Pseudonocardia autotrophica]BBG05056.1 histidine kinase [Pseudonocardia autotrophica]GEC27955.1 histidine kinase [Pseudonocardia saturnea]